MQGSIEPVPTLALAVAAAVLCHAALHDLAARTIPHSDSIAIVCIGLALRAWQRQLLLACAVAGVALLIGEFLWSRRWLGGGDVKLIAACTCLVAPQRVPDLIASVMCGGGLLALIYLCTGHLLRRWSTMRKAGGPAPNTWTRLLRIESWRVRRRAGLPYGVAISAAALLSMVRV
jgi:prepilin peptidase CpaA